MPLDAETSLFPSPIPVQCVSSDEFMPSRQTPKQKEYEARVKAIGSEMANERAKKLSGQFIMDMHFLSDDTRIQTFIAQRESVGKSSR